MKTLNKIILTSLIGAGSLGIFGKGYGQNKSLDSLLKQIDFCLKVQDSDELERSAKDISNRMKAIFPEYSSEKIYSENLCINLNDAIFQVTKKNEEQGIKDLMKICNEGYEEAWLYLPEKQIWYETGIYSDSNSVKPCELRTKKALEENKDASELIFYHNHPGEGFDRPSIRDMLLSIYHYRIFPEHTLTNKVITKDNIIELN